MTQEEARQFVLDNVSVRRHQVIAMKGLLLTHYADNSTTMLESAIRQLGLSKPASIVLHPTVDPVPNLRQFAEWISWWIAGCEALWGLVHSNVLIQVASSLNDFVPNIDWTTIVPGSGGERSGWRFTEFKVSYPHWVTRSRGLGSGQVLCDSDLFIHELALPDLHPEVDSALREAVACFRAEVYTASVVMLGKASEGAWIEMGLALLRLLPEEEAQKREKLSLDWGGPDVGFAKKMRDIMKLFESRQDVLRGIATAAAVRIDDLRMTMIWSESLRDARNSVHHNADPEINPTFEMVSTLFLAALPNLRLLHRLTTATRNV